MAEKVWKIGFRKETIEWIEIPDGDGQMTEGDVLSYAIALYNENQTDYIEEVVGPFDDITVEFEDSTP